MKKVSIYFLVTVMVFSLVFYGCSSKKSETEDTGSDTTQTGDVLGKVTAVDGNIVTIQVYSQQQSGQEMGQQNPMEMPTGEAGDIGGNGGGETPPEIPTGEAGDIGGNGGGETPPEIPTGGNSDIGGNGGGETPPEMPTGEAGDIGGNGGGNGAMGGDPMNTGESQTITIEDTSVLYKYENQTEVSAALSDITVGVILKITYDDNSAITKIIIGSESDFGMGGGGGSVPGGSTSDVVYGGSTEITSSATESGKTYASDTVDQSALLISTSENVTITDPTVTKTGDSNGGDNCNFYGQNAALLVKDGSTTTISGGTVSSSASGANGVFSYGGNGGQNGAAGDGTTVIISDTVITTTGDGSGGIMTTGGGITQASNLTVTTSGQSSAAIRTDRGGGTVTVDGGTYTTNGLGSPAIYSTADITVSNATLVSNLSEGVCIEGLNSITLNNSDLTANNTKCNGNATFYDTIMIYQSMSGDAASGTSSFTMNGGTLTSKKGHVFHVTNTNAVISLSGVTIVNEDSENVLISVCDDGWSGGSNEATLNASSQTLNGGVLVGDNSTLKMNLSSGSTFTGYINGSIKNASGTTVSENVGTVSVTLDETSTWTLTADSYVTSFEGNASNVTTNGYTLYVNGTALEGTN